MSDLLINELIDKGLDVSFPGLKETQTYPFRPVRCNEADLEKIQPVNGFVYFTLDTQKIFYGTGTEFLPMGGNSGLFYAHKTFEDPADTMFLAEDFDSGELPKNIDDLIINIGTNIERNGFYRVIDLIDNDPVIQQPYVSANQLPVGGGGTGGSGPAVQSGEIKIHYVSPDTDIVRAGEDYWITFRVEATDSAGDLVPSKGKAVWTIHGVRYEGDVLVNGQENRFNVGPYLNPLYATGTIKLAASFETGGTSMTTQVKTWSITAINLDLEWNYNYNFNNYQKEDNFILTWFPKGNTPCTTYVWYDDESEENALEIPISLPEMGKEISKTFTSLPYGAHTVHMKLGAWIKDDYFTTPTISHTLTFIKDGVAPILTVPFQQKTATQYSVVSIPFLVYDPKETEVEVVFKVNGDEVSKKTYNRDLQTLDYTCRLIGDVEFSLETNGAQPWKVIIPITQLDIDVSEVEDSKIFSLRANDFTINEEIQNWSQNGITLTFENFDWVNGGLKSFVTENGDIEKYICVRQGTRMIINYDLFGKNNTIAQNGRTFKFNFKATNCYDYEAPVLSCYDDASGLGLKINAQEATFYKDSTETKTYFYENSYIELENEIWPDEKDVNEWNVGRRYISFWADGVPTKMALYNHNSSFIQTNPKPITIGSDLCDVYVYAIKVYGKKLNEDDHIKNFVADAPTSTEMLKRYHRNDILDTNGQISYEKLIEKNPDCRIYLYELDADAGMTQNKDDKVPAKYDELRNEYNTLDKPYYHSDEAQVYVQGTSSAAYGRAAFNMRTRFKNGLIDKDGNEVELWQMHDEAIPIEIACTKVNVASCENANNVVNQEWYNKYQPYHDAHRRKTREDKCVYRDTMEFRSGVVFIKDNNKIINYLDNEGKPDVDLYLAANIFADEGTNYTNNPYYKFYSIGNMGNDKKNVEIFHDVNNPKACCVEVCNNQTAEQQMIVPVDMSAWTKESLDYEFRYPDGNDEATNEQKQAFIDFVNWMASCNPKNATNEPLPETKEYGPYTFKGFSPPGYEGKDSPTGITLKGFTVNTYVGSYTHDTYEYRMAKMLHECEGHLVMDSVVFHYLFIERHTMVDNVAKNTFWSTEDLIHWDLTKDYDNDTSDGIDNTGILSFSYGIECLDKNKFGEDIFNAPLSVWINFLYGLPEVRAELYNQLDQKGAWAPQPYLDEFKKHQDIIPERVWIANYIKQYLRPRNMGLDAAGSYVVRLDGGKKTHQRTQYEHYQDFYLKSRYQTSDFRSQSAALDLRLNSNPDGEWNTEAVIPITYYVDCYAGSEIGGVNINSPERIKRGQVFNLPVGQYITSPKDGTCYIYGSKMIQSLSNLAEVYPGYVAFGSSGKMRSLDLGSDADGYYNSQLKTFSISTNTMLQEANLQNVGIIPATAFMSLTLENLYSLEKLRLTGSSFTTLVLADGGVLEELHLNSLDTLRMYNLGNLTHEKVFLNNGEMDKEGNIFELSILDENASDEEIKAREERQYRYTASKLMTVNIENCPAMNYHGYKMLLYSPKQQFNEYSLTNINWNIDNIDDLIIEDGQVKGIKVLEKLKNSGPKANNHATSLTGIIKINVECNIDESYIYNTYYSIYPRLKIEYGEKVNLTSALRVNFYETDLDGAEYLFELLLSADNDKTLAFLTSSNGPAGEQMSAPIKPRDNRYNYYWNQTVEDKDWLIVETGETITHEEMLATVPESSMTFKPIFTAEERKYLLTLFDYNQADITPSDWPSDGFQYNAKIELPLFIYRAHEAENIVDGLDINTKRYDFKGWISSADYISNRPNPTLITDINITNDTRLYAYYKEEEVSQPSDNRYFDFDETNNTISLKEIYKTGANAFKGKLTLPAKSPNGNYIVKVAKSGFYGADLLEYVYFEDGCKYTVLEEAAFRGNDQNTSQLKAIYLPASLREIGDYSFEGQMQLLESNLDYLASLDIPVLTRIGHRAYRIGYVGGGATMRVRCSKLPDSVKEIGQNCFYYGGPNIKLTELPASLEKLESWSFAYCDNLQITKFGSDDPNSKFKTLRMNTFYYSGTNFTPPDNTIYLGASIQTTNKNIFDHYGNQPLTLKVPYSPDAGESCYYNNPKGLSASDIGVSRILLIGEDLV